MIRNNETPGENKKVLQLLPRSFWNFDDGGHHVLVHGHHVRHHGHVLKAWAHWKRSNSPFQLKKFKFHAHADPPELVKVQLPHFHHGVGQGQEQHGQSGVPHSSGIYQWNQQNISSNVPQSKIFNLHPMKFTMGVKLGVKVRQLETMIMLSWANHIQHPQVPYIFGISMTRRIYMQAM